MRGDSIRIMEQKQAPESWLSEVRIMVILESETTGVGGGLVGYSPDTGSRVSTFRADGFCLGECAIYTLMACGNSQWRK